MKAFFSRLRPSGRGVSSGTAKVPDGYCVYAVGDIHGRVDLLDRLLSRMAAHRASLGPERSEIVFLGDYVDRGLRSMDVIDRLLDLPLRADRAVFLGGNHEETLLSFLRRPDATADWLSYGGLETLMSYGVDMPRNIQSSLDGDTLTGLRDRFEKTLPTEHRAFFEGLSGFYETGDFFFTHAGIDPAKPLHRQTPDALRWIREPFLSHGNLYDKVIVHGHTVVDAVEVRNNRINLDTGAYYSGKLSAIALYDGRCDVLTS